MSLHFHSKNVKRVVISVCYNNLLRVKKRQKREREKKNTPRLSNILFIIIL